MGQKFFTLLLLFTMLSSGYAQSLQLNEENIDAIIKAMTLEEKVSLIVGQHDKYTPTGETMIGSQEKIVPGAAGISNGVARLRIPPTVLTDGPAGVRISEKRANDNSTYYATGFPIATAMASTWNTELIYETTKAMGNETLEYGCDIILAPGSNIHRHPLCGRNFEYFSEDPFLSGKMAAAYIKGVQSEGVGTSLKHFAANNQETLRMYNDSRVDERTLREIYLKPFEIAIREAKPWTVMSSYNKLNGTYTQYSHRLLTEILRNEWGFNGLVMTDWTGTRNTIQQIIAGNDMLQPGTDQEEKDLIEGAKNGKISMNVIDQAVHRILQYIIKTPRYKGYAFSNKPDLKGHATMVRHCGSEGIVLLKNDDKTLPLKKSTVALFGITSYDMIAGGTGSGDVHKAYISQLSDALEAQGFTLSPILKKLYTTYKAYAKTDRLAELGTDGLWRKPLLDEMQVSMATIERQADSTDVAILTIGRNAGESADRKIEDDFNLTAQEQQLLANICKAYHLKGKPVIVILNTSGVMETASWKSLPDAILLAWQPGQEAGNSVADILSGAVCPSGKLPTTFPNSCTDPLSARNFPLFGGDEKMQIQDWSPRSTIEYTNYDEGIYVGYRYFQTYHKAVSYPFGYGLSYTKFSYSNGKVKKTPNGLIVTVTVKNTGTTAGKEVVQLYVSAPQNDMKKPESELKAFAKTKTLRPGEQENISMVIDNYSLASYDTNQKNWVTAKGDYLLKISSDVDTPHTILKYHMPKTEYYLNNFKKK